MTPRRQAQQVCDLYVSHGGPRPGGLDWFIVKPGPTGPIEDEIQRLLDAGRTVYHIKAKPKLTERLLRKETITLRPTGIAPSRRRNERNPVH